MWASFLPYRRHLAVEARVRCQITSLGFLVIKWHCDRLFSDCYYTISPYSYYRWCSMIVAYNRVVNWTLLSLPRRQTAHKNNIQSLNQINLGMGNIRPVRSYLRNGKTALSYGKLLSSTMCQWKTFILFASMASSVCNMAGKGKKWRDVSSSSPRCG